MVTISPKNRPFISIRWKIVVSYLMLLSVALLIISVVVTGITGDNLLKSRTQQQLAEVNGLSTQIAGLVSTYNADELYTFCLRTSQGQGGRTFVLSPSGTVLTESHSRLEGTLLQNAEVKDLVERNQSASHGYHKITDENGTSWVGYYASTIIYEGERVGILLRSVSIQDVVDRIGELRATMLVYFFTVMACIVIVGFFITDIITRPIDSLSTAIIKTTRGDFTARAQVRGNDEISSLAKTFNMMSEKLEDVDRARSTFISNASHELKTPLSAIKVLVETILSEPEPKKEMVHDFLSDVNSEVDRLGELVVDLLALVQLDSKESLIKFEQVNLEELIRRTISRVMPLALKKKVHIEFTAQSSVILNADPARLIQVVYNLIDNAIKYSPDGRKVTVTLNSDDASAYIAVKDTGDGIPQKDLPRLFDRFYRVDEARSRGTGGSGLGLSIVKEIVVMHGGEIDVESTRGAGSTFTVTLPLEQGEA